MPLILSLRKALLRLPIPCAFCTSFAHRLPSKAPRITHDLRFAEIGVSGLFSQRKIALCVHREGAYQNQ